jgi:hypothetical protein
MIFAVCKPLHASSDSQEFDLLAVQLGKRETLDIPG